MRLLLKVIVLSTLLATSAAGQGLSRKDIYELQERCGHSARELFDRDFPKEDRKGLENFTNHYNVRLNKCFLLEENTTFLRGEGKSKKIKTMSLVDVQDNKSYGDFSPFGCDVQEQKCRTEQEFRALIRPYVEDEATH